MTAPRARRCDGLGRYLAYPEVRRQIGAMFSETVACRCCGYLTITDWDLDECAICTWFNDGPLRLGVSERQRLAWTGNNPVTLAEARRRFERYGCCVPEEAQPENFAIELQIRGEKRSAIAAFERIIVARDNREAGVLFKEAHEQLSALRARRLALQRAMGS